MWIEYFKESTIPSNFNPFFHRMVIPSYQVSFWSINRLATVHQRHRQAGQRSDSIGQTVLQKVAQLYASYHFLFACKHIIGDISYTFQSMAFRHFKKTVVTLVASRLGYRQWYIMAALRSRCGHYIFILWFLLSIFLFFSSPNLSRCRLDIHYTSTHGVALVRI